MHKYLYANADAVNMIDPTGRDTFELTLIDKYVILAVASGATYVAMTHTTTNSGALGALGITVACSIEWVGSKFGAEVGSAIYGGEVIQVGDCTWTFTKTASAPLVPPFELSKGGKQNKSYPWLWQRANNMPGDPCANLKQIRDNARGKDTALFLAARAALKFYCRGYN